ncbi:hypothetical protein Ais01nite_75170 [Asanoa ishikariensis]|uniref:Uncharacterized protein n=1 Tax=Asanoa ishikariensis TaxID=137265 RepID=A0A1H3L5P9_9ACTN|nr:hypothetical protein [Asanoa ishikariensis]GIF69482.1 hypothetical protein Ais01nite_75170 [Asanoa ishikariensis]SDY59711.1 hypothetical protein SAMN05421684_0552 [Asanoa ishikariensis]
MRGNRLFVQLGALWLFGGVLVPTAVAALTTLLWGAGDYVFVGLAVGLVLFAGYLLTVVTLTAPVTRLGATVPARLLWVVIVLVGGTVLWSQGWAFADAAELGISHNPWWVALFGGLAYALVAGFLLRGWRLNLTAVGVLLALTVGGLVALRAAEPEEPAGVSHGAVYVVEIPGYTPSDDTYGDRIGTGPFMPTDRSTIPALQYVNVFGYGPDNQRHPGGPGCGETLFDSPLSSAECTPEPGGNLVYRRGVIEHGYQVAAGSGSIVVVAGSLAVDRDLLRSAARSVRAGTATDVPNMTGTFYVADVPGYLPQPFGMPPGVQYLRADNKSGDRSVRITVFAVRADQGDQCFNSTCSPDGPDLKYLRRGDVHGYVQHRGDIIVSAEGGLLVDRELLRRVVLDARPATDAELLRVPPTTPPGDRYDRLRGWLRTNT